MKSCLICYAPAADPELTCLNCGEGSWSEATPDASPKKKPLSASAPYVEAIAEAKAEAEKPKQ